MAADTSVLISWLKRRIERNQNAIIVVNGPPGVGKSYNCISLALQISKELNSNFSIDTNVAFKFIDLLNKMNLPINKKRGTVFCFEEVGAFGGGASSREWQSQMNKYFFSFLQTSRHRNQILLMNCPDFHFLEAGARKLTLMQIDCLGIDYKKKVGIIKPNYHQVNSRSGKEYFKFLRYTKNGIKHRYRKVEVVHPDTLSPGITDIYEVEKMKFTTALNKTIVDTEKANETKGSSNNYHKKYTDEEIIERINKKMKLMDIARDLRVSHASISSRLNILGYKYDHGEYIKLPERGGNGTI